MQFLHPYALFGLLAISIPIIIHLFNFRRYKRLYFTNLNFLKNIRNETRKQHKLRHLLILLSRILAIVFLVLAFARPYIPGPGGEQKTSVRSIEIYIDNSMSMQSALNGISMLEIAKEKAREVIEAYGPSDRFRILTNDFEGRHQRYYNKDEVISMLDDVKITPSFKVFPEVYERMQSVENEAEEAGHHRYFISDFQRSAYDDGILETDSSDMLFYIPLLENAFGNVYIDSCWFDAPYQHLGQQQMVHARIKNASGIDLEAIPVRLKVDGVQAALGSIDIAANSNAEISLALYHKLAGWHTAEISLEDHPITWDDNFYLSWTVTESMPVLLISDEAPAFYFRSILAADSAFRYTYSEVNSLDYSQFSVNNLIILDQLDQISSGLLRELEKFVGSGGTVFVIPAEGPDLTGTNALLSALEIGRLGDFDTTSLKVTGLDASNAFFAEVFEDIPDKLDLPLAKGHFPLRSPDIVYKEVIMDLQNGDPYLLFGNYGKGKTYLLTSPLGDNYGNLARHALWVPVLYRMAMMSGGNENPYYSIGTHDVIGTDMDVVPEEKPFQIHLKGKGYSFIPAYSRRGEYIDLLLYNMVSAAGHYEYGSVDEFIIGFSFNYDRLESEPAIVVTEELHNDIEDQGLANVFVVASAGDQVSANIAALSQGKNLWKACVWIALLFILIEILLLRLFRK